MQSDFDRFWNYNDPAGSEAKFCEVLVEVRRAGDSALAAQLLTQIARAQGLQRKFDDAHATLDEVERTLETEIQDSLPRVRYLLERGRVFNSAGDAARARPMFVDAFELAGSNRLDVYAIDAAHMIAIVEPEPGKQLEWNLCALELAEKSPDERARRWRASLYNNIGWTYFDQKNYGKALEVFEKAVTLRAEQNLPRELRLARYCVAKVYRMQGRLDAAIAIHREIIEQAEQALQPDGYFHEELGECLLAADRADEARPHFRRAFEELSKDEWLSANEPERLRRARELSA